MTHQEFLDLYTTTFWALHGHATVYQAKVSDNPTRQPVATVRVRNFGSRPSPGGWDTVGIYIEPYSHEGN